jgi:hypothetical protein
MGWTRIEGMSTLLAGSEETVAKLKGIGIARELLEKRRKLKERDVERPCAVVADRSDCGGHRGGGLSVASVSDGMSLIAPAVPITHCPMDPPSSE